MKNEMDSKETKGKEIGGNLLKINAFAAVEFQLGKRMSHEK